jgi:hypothetical protein
MMWKGLTEEVGPLRERVSHTEILWIGRVLPCNILKCVGRIASISLSKGQSLLFKVRLLWRETCRSFGTKASDKALSFFLEVRESERGCA